MTTLQMEILLMNHFDIRRNLIVPGISAWSQVVRFETDLIILSKSNYATGIEIKVSKSDLKNDLKKDHIRLLDKNWFGKSGKEHYFKRFKYFYYAVPEKLKDCATHQIPEFCGLLVASKGMYDKEKFQIREERSPKKLFNTKWTDEEKYQMARLGSMRILDLKTKIYKQKIKEL